ncbi:MAG: hypothetical protein Q4P32_03760 [Micrococcales bacterium]|nr:hypothetical protein [Micrococcales bacterium]
MEAHVRQEGLTRTWHRVALLALGGACLLAGLDGALLNAGFWAPVSSATVEDAHGLVMVLGFLGTVIALERSVALDRPWAYLAPALLGLGGIAMAVSSLVSVGRILLLDGCVALVAVYVVLWRRNRDVTVLVQLVGAVCALCAVLVSFRLATADVLGLLVTFVVATIAAERVELARIVLPPGAGRTVAAFVVALMASAAAVVVAPAVAGRVFGIVLVVGTAWLLAHDVALRTVRATGLPRFSAVGMLLGYAWLLLAGAAWVAVGRPSPGTGAYDLVVHAVFLGFAMSMVLAHGPIILPALLRRPLPYRRWLYGPLVLLHLALVWRLGLGVLARRAELWAGGAMATVVALLLVPLTMAAATLLRPSSTRPAGRWRSPASSNSAGTHHPQAAAPTRPDRRKGASR